MRRRSVRALLRALPGFSLRRALYTAGLDAALKKGDIRRAEHFRARLVRLDGVGSNILVKYIAKELFLYFLICFLFFFVVFFVNQMLLLAETILQKRVPVGDVARLIVYCLPAIVAQSAPFATLVGFLMCLGRMVTDNEILILRASGQRYGLILVPVLVMGLLISLFSFVMNDYFLPLGTINYNRMRRRIIQSNPAVELESHAIKRMSDSTLVIGDVDKTSVSDLVLFDSDGGEQRIIVAGRSEVRKSGRAGILMELDMADALVLLLDMKNRRNFDVLDAEGLSLNVFESSIIAPTGGTSPREMTSYDLYRKIQDMQEKKQATKKQMNAHRLEFNKKFSIPFGSIFFAMLAFPLALVFGRKDGQTLGLIFGIIISVLYWAATILGQMFGLRGGYNGFWMMWGPNFFLGLLGVILYLKLMRK